VDNDVQQASEIRAARNQALFRSINDKLTKEASIDVLPRTFEIACECADVTCTRVLEIPVDEYAAVRANPRWFIVLHGHVFPNVETVIDETDTHVVVEKTAAAAAVAEALVNGR
jgi:hypothetical protein